MGKIIAVLKRKPLLLFISSLIYILFLGFIKWRLNIQLPAIEYLIGGIIGIYLLDFAEIFFNLSPSPFRTVVFAAPYMIISFFIVTSTVTVLASGLVLSLYFSLIIWQIGEWQIAKNLNSWFTQVAGGVDLNTQRWLFALFIGVFLIESFLFIR